MFDALFSWSYVVNNHIIKIATCSTDCNVVFSWNCAKIAESAMEACNDTVSSCFFQSLLYFVSSFSFANCISHYTKFWLFFLCGFVKGLHFLFNLLLSIVATRNLILTCLVLSLTILVLSLSMRELLLLHICHVWKLLSFTGNFIFLTSQWLDLLLPAINLKLQVSA